MSRAELRAVVAHLPEVAPPADADPDGEWSTALVERFASVRAFVRRSASVIVFALITLLGVDYRPQLADLPDAKLWRIAIGADYGPLNAAARGKIDLARIERQWPDILRVVASIHIGAVPAYDILRVLDHAIGQLRTPGYRCATPTSRACRRTCAATSLPRHYSFAPTNLAGERRALRDPDAPDED